MTNYLTFFEFIILEIFHNTVSSTPKVPCTFDDAFLIQLGPLDMLVKPVNIVNSSKRIAFFHSSLLIELDDSVPFVTKNNFNSEISDQFFSHRSHKKIDYQLLMLGFALITTLFASYESVCLPSYF